MKEATVPEKKPAERQAVLEEIERGWKLQLRRPTAAEIDASIAVGRP